MSVDLICGNQLPKTFFFLTKSIVEVLFHSYDKSKIILQKEFYKHFCP
jgi:hypothetical protein